MKRRRALMAVVITAIVPLLICNVLLASSTYASIADEQQYPPTFQTTSEKYQNRGITGAITDSVETLAQNEWPTLGANPQRTSWTPEEVRGELQPIWYRPLEPYINYKVQVIAANGLLYISTARGLYALNADNGNVAWVYPTELPLGHSPTVVNGVLYVGGYDRKIHALNALTGEKISTWTAYEAGAGFETNPLVVNGLVYAGNRDGSMYAFNAINGGLIWHYETGGPILFSAAYQANTIYFASNDSHAYALNAQTGALIWKSAKLPGAGFHSYWPVIYGDWVIFAGSNNYRIAGWRYPNFGSELQLTSLERDELYPHRETDPKGTLIGPVGMQPGDWAPGTITIDMSRVAEYLEKKPWRRTYFVLNRFTGKELTFDSDGDSKPEYAPFAWTGTHSGNRYPPVIGSDGVLYQQSNYISDLWIPGSHGTGWKFGTKFISRISGDWNAVDEPMAFSAGGDLIYWSNTVDRGAGAYDITVPYVNPGRSWDYWGYNLQEIIPGYDLEYYMPPNTVRDYGKTFGNVNGVYGVHGVQNPLIPYRGKLYTHRGNSIIALAPTSSQPVQLPLVKTIAVQDLPRQITTNELKQKLALEVEKILEAGHLRPGYHSTGIADAHLETEGYLLDYWSNPGDTLYTLIWALPYLDPDLQQRTKNYLQQEFATYPPYQIAHIGWKDGAQRELFDLPPEIDSLRSAYGPQTNWTEGWWKFPQDTFYSLWKYAQVFGGAGEIFDQIQDKIEAPPSNSFLANNPHIHNAYIAGYIGYLELQKLAGKPESTSIKAELQRLMQLRITNFSKVSPFTDSEVEYRRNLNVSRNFMYLVPELADYLHDYAYNKVQDAVNEYNTVAPAWFVSKYDATLGEGTLQQLYDYHSLFQAKALILKESREKLVKYLDVPAFQRGDLFYIQNLIIAIEAPFSSQNNSDNYLPLILKDYN